MNKLTFSLLILLMAPLLSMTNQSSRTILFFGDSITQQASKDGGFIRLLEDYLQTTKNTSTKLINAGIGGNKVTDLYLRFQQDVISKKPDEVLIWIGINDVWHRDRGVGTDLTKFLLFYQEMIDQLKANQINVTLGTPGVIGEHHDNSNPHDGNLNAFSKAIRALAKENDCKLIDFRKEFQAYELKNNLENKGKGILTTDGVHLNAKGNQVVAELIKASLML